MKITSDYDFCTLIGNSDFRDMLSYGVENNMLDLAQIQARFDDMKREALLKKHQYSVWQGENGNWYTYIIVDGRRVLKKRKTQKDIEDLVIKYVKEHIIAPNMISLFAEANKNKLDCNSIKKQSFDRYENDFKQFIEPYPIAKKDINTISEYDLEKFVLTVIKDLNLSRKRYSAFRTIINMIFKLAKKRGYTNISISQFFGDLELSKNLFKKAEKDEAKEAFSEEEMTMVKDYVMGNPTIRNLAVLLVFYTGLRVGELAALKRADFCGDTLKVSRTEIKVRGEDGKWKAMVGDYTKTEAGNRCIIIPRVAREVVDMIFRINPFGEFLFMEDGKRITENALRRSLYRICENLGIQRRSIHKARKTYGTILLDAQVDDSIVTEMMGHSDVSTTRKYYYRNNKSQERKFDQINRAIAI